MVGSRCPTIYKHPVSFDGKEHSLYQIPVPFKERERGDNGKLSLIPKVDGPVGAGQGKLPDANNTVENQVPFLQRLIMLWHRNGYF